MRKIVFIFVVIALVAIAFAAGFYYSRNIPNSINIGGILVSNETINTSSLVGNDFVEIKPIITGTRLALISGCTAIAFDVTLDQAMSIQRGIEKTIDTRPLTHDLLKDVFENFNIKMLAAEIDRFENEIYYAKLLISGEGKILNIDSRPSDAVAISVREGTPIYIKKDILEKNGVNIC